MSLHERVLAFIAVHRHISAQLFRYLVSGITSNLTELILLYMFTQYFGVWYIFSLMLAFTISFWVSFLLQKFWTFQDKKTHRVHIQASSYLIVSLANLTFNIAALYVLVQFFGIWYMLAQISIIGAIAVSNFLLYKFVIFKKHEPIIQ